MRPQITGNPYPGNFLTYGQLLVKQTRDFSRLVRGPDCGTSRDLQDLAVPLSTLNPVQLDVHQRRTSASVPKVTAVNCLLLLLQHPASGSHSHSDLLWRLQLPAHRIAIPACGLIHICCSSHCATLPDTLVCQLAACISSAAENSTRSPSSLRNNPFRLCKSSLLYPWPRPPIPSRAPTSMSDSTANAPKPSSSVKLVLLGEAAVGKVRYPHADLSMLNKQSASEDY